MLFRTQNRLGVVNLNYSDCLAIKKIWKTKSECCSIVAYNGNSESCLGTYQNKQRAIEVLDEICNAYIGLNDKDRKTGFAYVKNGIYQMPAE